MKCLLTFLLTSFFVFSLQTGFCQEGDYRVLSKQSKGGVELQLEIHEEPSMGNDQWLKFVMNFPNDIELEVVETSFSSEIQLKGAEDGNSTKYLDGLFNQGKKLKPGNNSFGQNLSRAIGVELGFGAGKPMKVEGLLNYKLKLKGDTESIFEIKDLPFSFEWFAPNALQYIMLQDEMSDLLKKRANGQLDESLLELFLDNKEMVRNLDAPDLLLARDKRKNDGKYYKWITSLIGESFGNHPSIIQDYLKRFQNEFSFDALLELKENPSIWDIDLLEPLIKIYSQENPGIMYRVMDILYLHRTQWSNVNRNRLSEITKKVYKSIYESSPEEIIQSDQIAYWCSMAVLLGKTGDEQHIAVLKPFLEVKENALKNGFPGVSGETRPLRVCDNAMEAILAISGQDITEMINLKDLTPEEIRVQRDEIISNLLK